MIKLDDICCAYDSTPVLKHFSTEVADGEFVVIKGDNGCGKSTLLNIINALEFAEIGTYTFDGTVIDKKAMKNEQFAKAFHQKIGYVFQNTDAQLFCSSVYDEIAFAPRQMQLDEAEVAKRGLDPAGDSLVPPLNGRKEKSCRGVRACNESASSHS